MLLSDKPIAEFQTLYKNRFGKEIDRKEAHEKGLKLIQLIETIYRPKNESETKKIQ